MIINRKIIKTGIVTVQFRQVVWNEWFVKNFCSFVFCILQSTPVLIQPTSVIRSLMTITNAPGKNSET
jgi:hypothetical protein